MRAWVVVVALLSACTTQPQPCPPSSGTTELRAGNTPCPPSSVEPLPGPVPSTPCGKACHRLRVLGCQEAQPTPRGLSCEEVCLQAEASGFVSVRPDCVSQVATCADVPRCAR